MREGGDWIIYLFAILFFVHVSITIGVLIYRMTRTKEVKERNARKKQEQDKEQG